MNLDFETYSDAGYEYDLATGKFKTANTDTGGAKNGLPLVGAYVYAQHPSTEILTASYSFDGGKTVERWKPEDIYTVSRSRLTEHVSDGGLVTAWNSFFEWCIWNLVGVPKYGFPPLPISQTRDTMARAYAWSLPGALGKASAVLFGESEKSTVGKRLIRKFACPRNPTKNDHRIRCERPKEKPPEIPVELQELTAPQRKIFMQRYGLTLSQLDFQDWKLFDEYCDQDVRAEANIGKILPELSPGELEVWLLDQKINSRGIKVDLALIEPALRIMADAKLRAGAQLSVLTNGEITAVSQATAMLKWVNRMEPNKYLKSLEVPILTEYITKYTLNSTVAEVLSIRLLSGGNAPAKLIAMKYQSAEDGRVRGVYQYRGAQRTGRWAGRGIQTQNMPNFGPKILKCSQCGTITEQPISYAEAVKCGCSGSLTPTDWGIEGVEAVLPELQTGDYEIVNQKWGNPAKVVAGCLRSMLIPEVGYDYISSDYSAIEAVVMACMAGEQWIIDVFFGDGKLYERTGAKITGVDIEEILQHKTDTGVHHSARKLGKVASLASQYQGARGAWLKFGADKFLTNKEIDEGVKGWRQASPNIVGYWYAVEDAAKAAIQTPGTNSPVLRRDGTETGVSFQYSETVLYCYLPSGDYLTYINARIVPKKKLSHDGWRIIELCEILSDGKSHPEEETEFYNRKIETDVTQVLLGRLETAGYQITSNFKRQLTACFYTWGETIVYMGVGLNNSWVEMETYGGKLAENITQATARFILSSAMLRIESAEYPIVMHTHDEMVSEIPEDFGSIEEYEKIMSIMPDWAKLPDGRPWPIKAAGGWRGKRYRK